MTRWYVGLAATFHDPAVAIVDPLGEPVFAEETERYMQCKRAYNCPPDDMIRMPELIREYCDPDAEVVAAVSWSASYLAQLNLVVGAATVLDRALTKDAAERSWPLPDPASLLIGLRNSIGQAGVNLASSRRISNPVVVAYYDHHLTHAAAAAYSSPFEECVVAVVDAYGEKGSTAFFHYRGGTLVPVEETRDGPAPRPGSLGFFYGRLCALCGFDPVKGEEWKVMGLAAYGRRDPRLYELLRPMVGVDGLTTVQGCTDEDLSRRVRELRSEMRAFGTSPAESADLACTGQAVFEDVMTELLDNLHAYGISDNLAMAGGCALNSAYNGRILERTPFTRLHVPSAPADDGSALGAAYQAYHEDHPEAGAPCRTLSPYLGSSMSTATLEQMGRFGGFQKVVRGTEDVDRRAAALLAEGKIIGWVQGRAEFGPRALGNRSILADPRPRDMQDRINARVKFREQFRPFAPSVLDEHGPQYFEHYQTSPYMERTLRFRPEVRDRVPAVVHVDGTGRLQSVRREWNPRYYALIDAFYGRTGVPMVLNTSLNVMGKPIVHSVEDALGMFFTSGLDALVIEDVLIEK